MKEFDELLNEVLLEDGNREPPIGMERRIALALSSERKRVFIRRKILREALAATILLGLAGIWALSRSQRMVPVASKPGFVGAPKSIADNTASLPLLSRDSGGADVERASIPERRPRRRPQGKTLRLAPLEIEPLVIKPIEIASLTSSTSTGKGEVR
jgi:hypothetical protein